MGDIQFWYALDVHNYFLTYVIYSFFENDNISFLVGEVPYPGIRSRDVQAYLRNGNRMDKPEFANDL